MIVLRLQGVVTTSEKQEETWPRNKSRTPNHHCVACIMHERPTGSETAVAEPRLCACRDPVAVTRAPFFIESEKLSRGSREKAVSSTSPTSSCSHCGSSIAVCQALQCVLVLACSAIAAELVLILGSLQATLQKELGIVLSLLLLSL